MKGGVSRAKGATDCSVKVRFNSQVIIGRFLRSLYVGMMTEYLSVFVGAIIAIVFSC